MSASPLHLLSFESRRADEMAALIERHGGQATVVPSMREVPLAENRAVLNFADTLIAGGIDITLFTTGIGVQVMLDVIEDQGRTEEFLAALDRNVVATRGPKPAAVLSKRGVRVDWKTAEPHSWAETLALFHEHDIDGRTIAIQEYGKQNPEFVAGLERAGAAVIGVPVYRWELPEETSGIEQAIDQLIAGRFDACLLTSAQQLENVWLVASRRGVADELHVALRSCLVASIGPTCSQSLRERGLPPDIEASPPKMGNLVRRVIADGPALLADKHRPTRDGVPEGE